MERRYIVGIGPGKSGSTWLYTFLRSSAEVCCSNIKETDYVLNTSVPNENEYLKRYFASGTERSLFCEVSNTYLYHPEFIKRAAAMKCRIDLVSILRDPIDRTVSHVEHLMRNGADFESIEDALYQRPDILARGLYTNYLAQFRILPRNINLHILSFDDLVRDETSFQDSLLQQLGMDPAFLQEDQSRRFSRASARSKRLARVTKALAAQFRRRGMGSLVQRVKDGPLPALLYKEKDGEDNLFVGPEVLNFMKSFYEDSDRRLQLEWSIDTSGWKSQSHV